MSSTTQNTILVPVRSMNIHIWISPDNTPGGSQLDCRHFVHKVILNRGHNIHHLQASHCKYFHALRNLDDKGLTQTNVWPAYKNKRWPLCYFLSTTLCTVLDWTHPAPGGCYICIVDINHIVFMKRRGGLVLLSLHHYLHSVGVGPRRGALSNLN